MTDPIFNELQFNTFFTPEWCYEILPIDWTKYKTAYEPSMGDGRILLFLEEMGVETVDGSEIQFLQMNDQTATPEDDFFKWDGTVDLIMGNPPYTDFNSDKLNYDLAIKFVEHALPRCKTLMFFLPLAFLGAKARFKLFFDNPADVLFVSSEHFKWDHIGQKGPRPPMAWFIWQQAEKHIPSGIYPFLQENQIYKDLLNTTKLMRDDNLTRNRLNKSDLWDRREVLIKEFWERYKG